MLNYFIVSFNNHTDNIIYLINNYCHVDPSQNGSLTDFLTYINAYKIDKIKKYNECPEQSQFIKYDSKKITDEIKQLAGVDTTHTQYANYVLKLDQYVKQIMEENEKLEIK
jgi:hypothetical protein